MLIQLRCKIWKIFPGQQTTALYHCEVLACTSGRRFHLLKASFPAGGPNSFVHGSALPSSDAWNMPIVDDHWCGQTQGHMQDIWCEQARFWQRSAGILCGTAYFQVTNSTNIILRGYFDGWNARWGWGLGQKFLYHSYFAGTYTHTHPVSATCTDWKTQIADSELRLPSYNNARSQ